MESMSELALPLEEFRSVYRLCIPAVRRESLPGIAAGERDGVEWKREERRGQEEGNGD